MEAKYTYFHVYPCLIFATIVSHKRKECKICDRIIHMSAEFCRQDMYANRKWDNHLHSLNWLDCKQERMMDNISYTGCCLLYNKVQVCRLTEDNNESMTQCLNFGLMISIYHIPFLFVKKKFKSNILIFFLTESNNINSL